MMDQEAAWRSARGLLEAYLRRRVPPEAVDDLLGDILLQAVRYRDGFEAASNPLAWLRRVAMTGIADFHRKREPTAVADEVILQAMPEMEKDEAGKRLAQCLRPLIAQLPDKYAEALLLVDIGNLRLAEAADRAQVTLPAMKARLRRGRRQLKAALLACCHVEQDRRGGIVDYAPRGPAEPGPTPCCQPAAGAVQNLAKS